MEITMVIQFRTSEKQYFGTLDELHWRHEREDELDKLLRDEGLGDCDGGQAGGGSMEIFCYVTDIQRAVELVRQYLTNHEWIQFCKIASWAEDADGWVVQYPEGASFSAMEWT